jgi:C4-dicarboxylate-specific signal transduction histidine kinase
MQNGATPILTAQLSSDFQKDLNDILMHCNGRAPCAMAVSTQKNQIVEDIRNSNCSDLYKNLASKWNLGACWSYPVFDHKNELHSVLSVYSRLQRGPTQHEAEFIASQISVLKMAFKLDEMRIHAENDRLRMIGASKLATLGEMAAGLAHEINNPLAVISGYSNNIEFLLTEKDLDVEQLKTSCQAIERSVQRIANIVSGLRYFSKDVSTKDFEPILIKKIIDDTLGLCAARIRESHIKIEVENNYDDLEINCRGPEISRMLLNMIQNAYEAAKESKDKWIRIHVEKASDWLFLIVSDSGAGVPEDVRDKLFQPFFTTKSVGEGLGLGLSVCRGIAEAHGGKIVYSPKDNRTEFCVTLPLSNINSDNQQIKKVA